MARRKQVFPTARIAHMWAYQSNPDAFGVPSARNPRGNFWYQGGILYSYTTPIANRVERRGKGELYLVSDCAYSATTNKHQQDARRSVPNSERFVIVNCVEGTTTHVERKAEFRTRILAHLATAEKARAAHTVRYARQAAARTVSYAERYAEFFGFTGALYPFKSARELAEYGRRVSALYARETMLRERADVLALKRRDNVRAQYDNVDYAQGLALDVEAANAEREAKRAERIAEWRAGEHTGGMWYDGGTYLRRKGDTVETSRGAVVPLAEAQLLYGYWQQERQSLAPKWLAMVGARVGEYTVRAVTPERMTIGCHVLYWGEVETFAAMMGW